MNANLFVTCVRAASRSRTAVPIIGMAFGTMGPFGALAAQAAATVATVSPHVSGSAPAGELADTQWRLVEFQSMDDATGTVRPDDRSLYTMRLNGDGTVYLRLNCNRASGAWSAEPGGDGASGRFAFGLLSATSAVCPPPSMDESIAAHAQFIRSYLLKDGRLYLSLMADGGIYAWEPDAGKTSGTGEPSGAGMPAGPEDGGPRNWEVAGVSRALNLRERPSTTARIVAAFGPGAILDNLGCQRADDRVWCDVQPFGGGPRGGRGARRCWRKRHADGRPGRSP